MARPPSQFPSAWGGSGREVTDYAVLARLAHVSRPHISQIMSPTLLAADIHEAILFLPRHAIRTWPAPPQLVRGPQRLSESP